MTIFKFFISVNEKSCIFFPSLNISSENFLVGSALKIWSSTRVLFSFLICLARKEIFSIGVFSSSCDWEKGCWVYCLEVVIKFCLLCKELPWRFFSSV